MMRLELLGNGTTSILSPLLINRDVLEVSVDGVGRSKLKSAGSPVDKEVVYDMTLGTLTFDEVIDNGTQIFVLYQNV